MVIKIHTVNNPFEVVKLTVTALSYYHDICLELTPCNQKVISNSSVGSGANIGYHIDFGFSLLNFLQKKYFTIKNNSKTDIYRFEFATFSQLTFVPRVGHLKPFASKNVIATFSTTKPLHFDKVMIQCDLNKIEFVYEEEIEELSWDDRQQFVTCEDLSKVSEEAVSEMSKIREIDESSDNCDMRPSTEIFPRTNDRPEPAIFFITDIAEVIPLYFTIFADYSSYTCKINDIGFPDTFIKTKSEVKFEVENNGLIPLDITWDFSKNEIVQTRASSTNYTCTKDSSTIYSEYDKSTVKSSVSSTTLFSSDCSCSCLVEEAIFPFSITPQTVSIYPNKCQQFFVYFEPVNMSRYCVRLKSNISGLEPMLQNIDVKVTGTSVLPVCYVDIEESDYFNRRPANIQNYVNYNFVDLKIIEFRTIGTGVSMKKIFNLVNPTNEIISYKFESLDENQQFSYFTCKTETGVITEEKQTEIVFTFKSPELGNFEEYYMCHILGKDFKVPFLLAGSCRQPIVYFTESYVTVEPTILLSKMIATAILRNEEDIELSFKFYKESLFNENHDQQLEVVPMSGVVLPKTDINIRITYLAQKTGKTHFYLKCAVEKVKTALRVNVGASCVEVSPKITYTDKEGKTALLEKDKENVIELGNIPLHQRNTILFNISNIGETGFFYKWSFNKKPIEHLFEISINSEKDFVPRNNESIVILYLKPRKYATLQLFKVKINISYGPTYIININATAEKPSYTFSFNDYNFGYCIVQKKETDYYNVVLVFKNCGKKRLSLENCYESTKDLTVDFKSAQVSPSATQNIPIYFHPLKVGQYKINIPFAINFVQCQITVYGEAVNINLQTAEISDRFIDLGTVMVGTLKKYVVQVINRTPAKVNAFFDLWEKLPIHTRPKEMIESGIKVPELPPPAKKGPKGKEKRHRKTSKSTSNKSSLKMSKRSKEKKEKSKSSKGSKSSGKKKEKKNKKEALSPKKKEKSKSSKGSKSSGKKKGKKNKKGALSLEPVLEPIWVAPKKTIFDYLKILPNNCIQIKPNKECEIAIEYCPEERLKDFSVQIFYEVQDHVEPLCIVKGSCIAPEFSLANEYLSFANIVVGCRHDLSVSLRNTGDITGRFKWSLEKKMNVFNVIPDEGFIAPGSEMKIWFSFQPKTVECLFEEKAKCAIEGVNEILELKLLGNSVKIPKPIATLNFTCPVRGKTEQPVKISNQNPITWNIYPLVSNDQFNVQKEIIINPHTEYSLVVTYCPKQMTKSENQKAMLLLPLPEGQVILYELIGTSLPPLPIQNIEIEINCKQNHTKILHIENWLPTEQCFNVKTELTSPVTTQSLYKVFGNDIVELAPNDSKCYKWGIYVINEIPLTFKVMFINTETEEYMFYEISVKVLPSGPLETIKLTTRVRELGRTTLKLQNLINLPVTFHVDIDVPDLIFDNLVPLDPYSTHDLDIQYYPLKSDNIIANIKASCAELGTFIYQLKIIVDPPKPENAIKFKAELGDRTTRWILFKNTSNSECEVFAKFDHFEFSMEKVGPILSGDTTTITFSYEPCDLGILHGKLILTSTTAGDYKYPLIGECILPKPKGPFMVKAGSSTSISFINPYINARLFNFALDSNKFFLKTQSEVIKAKRNTKITVNMQPSKNFEANLQKCLVTGKLTVSSEDDNIQWVYYIQGDI